MKEIDAVYRREMVPSSLWLCKFYALMALGEIYTHRRGVGDNNRVPGTNYYVRAVGLLQENQDYYEEPSLMQVEVLTLLVRKQNPLERCYLLILDRLGPRMSSVVSEQHTATAASQCASLKVSACTDQHRDTQPSHQSNAKVEDEHGGYYTSSIDSLHRNSVNLLQFGTKI